MEENKWHMRSQNKCNHNKFFDIHVWSLEHQNSCEMHGNVKKIDTVQSCRHFYKTNITCAWLNLNITLLYVAVCYTYFFCIHPFHVSMCNVVSLKIIIRLCMKMLRFVIISNNQVTYTFLNVYMVYIYINLVGVAGNLSYFIFFSVLKKNGKSVQKYIMFLFDKVGQLRERNLDIMLNMLKVFCF